MTFEKPETEQPKTRGIQNYKSTKYENGKNYYVVSIVWKDGKEVDMHFPTDGFPVVDPKTNVILGHISGEKAIEILKKHSAENNQEDFHWRNFLSEE